MKASERTGEIKTTQEQERNIAYLIYPGSIKEINS
jgi:hypothetical protein